MKYNEASLNKNIKLNTTKKSCIAFAILLFVAFLINAIFINFKKYDNILSNISSISNNKINISNILKTNYFTSNQVNNIEQQRALINNNISNLNQNATNVQKELEEKRIKQAQILMNMSLDLNEVLEVEKNIINTVSQIDNLNLTIEIIEVNLRNAKSRLKNAENKVKRTENNFKTRLRAVYTNGNNKSLLVLFKSKGIIDFISNYNYLKLIAQSDKKLLSNIKEDRRQLKLVSDEIRKSEEELLIKKKELERQIELNQYYVILKNAKINKLSEDERELVADITKLEQEKLEIEGEITRQTASLPKIPVYVGGIFQWPVPTVNTNLITARFRQSGSSWSSGYHTGVDIAIPSGTVGQHMAVAAQDGRVIVSVGDQGQSRRSYGNYVVIDHGGGVYSLYAHAHSTLVTVGQNVKKGEPVIVIGNSGNSSGPHLHFEIRINGSSYSNVVDPLPYITSNKQIELPQLNTQNTQTNPINQLPQTSVGEDNTINLN